jgi:hypothetical protein
MNAKFTTASLLLAGLLFVAASTAHAQPGAVPGAGRPSFSPYLNLLRSNTPTYLNYYGLVRPEQRYQSGLNTLQQQVGNLNQSVNTLSNVGQFNGPGSDISTGHPFGFQTQRTYFQTTGLGGGIGGGGIGGGSFGGGSAPRIGNGGGMVGGGGRQAVTPGRR